MRIDHEVMGCCTLHYVKIVVRHPLSVMVFGTRDEGSDIACFDSWIVVAVHIPKSVFHLAFVVDHGRSRLMVHDERDAALARIGRELGNVEVGIGAGETIDMLFVACPIVFPAFVPAFDEDGIEAMASGKIDVIFDMCGVGAVMSVGGQETVVGAPDEYVLLVGISPRGAASCEVFPPNSDVFHGTYP